MKVRPDVNATLCDHGPDAVRERSDNAERFVGPFKLVPFDLIQISTALNYLVKGVLPRIGLAIVWGPPKCGKSFWTFDLLMHVALGWTYRNRRVQQGTVVYLALEGGHGFRNRVEAWRRQHLNGHRRDVPFYLIDVPVDLVADRDKLIEAIRAQLGDQAPSAVCIDTLNRALIGDENKSDDMAKFIRAADLIREAFGCVVIIIHHCGTAGNRPRGHTSLSGADDAQIAVGKNDEGIITATVEHMKDGEPAPPMGFRLESVELGSDDAGDPLTSCVIVEAEIVPKEPKLPDGAKLALRVLQDVMTEAGAVPPVNNYIPSRTLACSAIEWREAFYRQHPAEKLDTRSKAFVRASLTLQERGII